MKKLDIEKKGSLLIFSLLIIMLIVVIFFSVCPRILGKLNLTNTAVINFFEITEEDNTKIVNYSKLYPFDKESVSNVPQGGGLLYI